MALRNVTVERLSVEVNELSDRGMSFRVRFTDGTDTFNIEIPRVILEQLQELIQEFGYSVSREIEGDDPVRDLIAAKNYQIRLQS
jgi:hypothetical protein